MRRLDFTATDATASVLSRVPVADAVRVYESSDPGLVSIVLLKAMVYDDGLSDGYLAPITGLRLDHDAVSALHAALGAYLEGTR